MNPIVEFFNLLDAVTMKLLGLHFSIGNIVVLLTFFWFGTLFGRLTRQLSLFRVIVALILGAFLWDLLRQTHFPIVVAFLLGILAKHSYLYFGVFSWARDLSDIAFAFRYRQAYEDIQRRERELNDWEQKLRQQARANTKSQSESSKQQQWREKTRSQRNEENGGNSSSGSSQREQTSSKSESFSRTSGNAHREQLLQLLGLDPTKPYSKDVLKAAYRKKAKETHPDLGGTDAAFREIASAYEALLKGI